MVYSIENNILTIKSDYKGGEVDEEIKKIIVSNNISDIKFYSSQYEILNELNFAGSNIKSLIIISSSYNEYINNDGYKIINLNNLPSSLELLELLNSCKKMNINPQIFKNLPPNLKKLKLYSCDDITLDNLPNSLEILDISCYSNQKNILDYLPTSLKILNIKLTKVYKSAQNNQTGTFAFASDFYDNEINFDSLPSGLESLKIFSQYDDELNCLPINLKILHLPSEYTKEIKNIPKNLEELKIPLKYGFLNNFNICKNLKKIIIGFSNKSHIQNTCDFDLTQIPNSIEEIEFGDDFNQQIKKNLPPNIKKIIFGFNFKPHSINLVDSIEHLEFGYNFNGIIKTYPSNLKYLKFGRNFNQYINLLPEGLIFLSINERYHSKINKLPSTLEFLEFNSYAEYNYDIMCIPDSVHTLILGKYMDNNKINIPKNLKNITYPKNNIWIKEQLDNIGFTGTITIILKLKESFD
jgi:hypothetical protein